MSEPTAEDVATPIVAVTFAGGETHAVLVDGTYVVTSVDGRRERRPVLSAEEPGSVVVTPRGRARLTAALDAAGFADLPDRLEPDVPVGVLSPRTHEPPTPQPIVVRAAHGGRVRDVTVVGDPAFPETLGPLAGVIEALDEEAIGDWMNE